MESRMGGMSAKCKESKEKNPWESQYGEELTVAITVQRMPLKKRLIFPSCVRTKVKRAVRSAPARNWVTQRLDETDLCSPARDDAKRITVTDIMVKISKLHAETSYGFKNGESRMIFAGRHLQKSPYGRVAIVVHRTLLNKRLVRPA